MQLKKICDGAWEVFVAGRAIGCVRKVPQNPSYGRGSGPVSANVMVWGAFINGRIGMDFRTRHDAGMAVLRAYERLNPGPVDAPQWRPEDYVAG